MTSFTTRASEGELYVIADGLLGDLPPNSLLAAGCCSHGRHRFHQAGPRRLRVHGSPNAPAVDIRRPELGDNLGFGQLSGAIQVPPGSYTLDFFGHAEGSTVQG